TWSALATIVRSDGRTVSTEPWAISASSSSAWRRFRYSTRNCYSDEPHIRYPTHPLAQIVRRSCRTLDHQFATLGGYCHATGNLHGREKLGGLCSLEPFDFQQCDDWCFDHRSQ